MLAYNYIFSTFEHLKDLIQRTVQTSPL